MKSKLLTMLFLICAVLLCACTKEMPAEETALPAVTEQYTEATEPETRETTEMTSPPHSELYLSDYTAAEIWEYFEEVVLHVEYTDGTGDASLVQKWQNPIGYRIFGEPTMEDLCVLETLFFQLNQIPGFPGIYEANYGETEQLRISFLDQEVFQNSFSSVVGGEEATGATEYWYYINTNEIHSARIGYRTDLSQDIRNSVLLEEIVNTLGISDTVLRSDSITYQYSDDNTVLSDVDWLLLRLLYHPDIHCGMDAEACEAVLAELYY